MNSWSTISGGWVGGRGKGVALLSIISQAAAYGAAFKNIV